MNAKLLLEDGSIFNGTSFGWSGSVAGEVVFNTGMVGYPECFTDPSYKGQILILTYPLIGNYGVPAESERNGLNAVFESKRIQISGLVVSEYSANFSHWDAQQSLASWLKENRVPGLAGVDTRMLTQKLRTHGCMLGKLVQGEEPKEFYDPNRDNVVAQVSVEKPVTYGSGKRRVVVIDCGCKNNILRSLLARNVEVTVVPWNWPVEKEKCDGVLISNGPGDPKICEATINTVRKLLKQDKPVFGICLGSQILGLAAGADTFKLKYGHRGQNQPCVLVGSKRCFITSQNHGYAVDENTLPAEWEPWFFNANDGTNEGIRHRTKPFSGVQFHPEASPGPVDTKFLFDEFVGRL
ncbi:glutamine-hydrolyzing carbamoyl-phosphate synthase small subunit [candidate division KSB1 bacterium]|nr:glutamine-hydrolyzing carbamoyl-phosphate synthase small subunit [candidate division KSB1 bacterium]